MNRTQKLTDLAQKITAILSADPCVQSCTVCGSLAEGRADVFSDIDLEVDVSGHDNGRFMLELSALLGRHFPILWQDSAPSLVPDKYVVSIALDPADPFCFIDFACTATPHCTTVTRDMIAADFYTHTLKLWVINMKHYLRGTDCERDIRKMARRLYPAAADTAALPVLLADVLGWLAARCPVHLTEYMNACQQVCDQHIEKME